MEYEPTEHVETPTIYLGDAADPRRIRVSFPDAPADEGVPASVLEVIKQTMPGLEEIPQEPALLEIFGPMQHAEIAVETPDLLEEIAKGLNMIALEWRHVIKECSCYTEDGEHTEDAEETVDPLRDIFVAALDVSDLNSPPEPPAE